MSSIEDMAKAGILIVEDSFIVAYHLKTTLEGEGYTVFASCDTGEAAIQFMESTRPDLVLMDIMLTGKMDGIEAAGIIRSRFNVPVVFITALTDKETIGRAKVTEPYGYLTKPFEDHEIFTVIEMALYKHDIESRLRQSEEKYFLTINSISDAVVSIDQNFCISYMNASALALTQWTIDEALGKPITLVLNLRDEATEEVAVNPVQCSIGTGSLNRMPDDLILVGSHGKEAPIGESSLSPLLDNNGNVAGLIMVFKDMTEKRDHQRMMEEIERERMAALIEGQEKERARIAKDLHDGLGQMLNAIKMNTDRIVHSNTDAANLSRMLDEAIQESIRMAEDLLPSKLRDFDLSVCLRSLCNSLAKSVDSRIIFEAHGNGFEMSQSQKVNFYRIAQEAVNNAIKHAQAHCISVQLNEGDGSMRLSIEDDGVGTTLEMNGNGRVRRGLVNMRDRAEIMGGKFTIESDKQRGTLVIVEVPSAITYSHGQN